MNTDSDKAPTKLDEIRCECGRMLARQIAGGVELKCNRCSRLLRLTIDVVEEQAT